MQLIVYSVVHFASLVHMAAPFYASVPNTHWQYISHLLASALIICRYNEEVLNVI